MGLSHHISTSIFAAGKESLHKYGLSHLCPEQRLCSGDPTPRETTVGVQAHILGYNYGRIMNKLQILKTRRMTKTNGPVHYSSCRWNVHYNH